MDRGISIYRVRRTHRIGQSLFPGLRILIYITNPRFHNNFKKKKKKPNFVDSDPEVEKFR